LNILAGWLVYLTEPSPAVSGQQRVALSNGRVSGGLVPVYTQSGDLGLGW
jgi:hypothetical protein